MIYTNEFLNEVKIFIVNNSMLSNIFKSMEYLEYEYRINGKKYVDDKKIFFINSTMNILENAELLVKQNIDYENKQLDIDLRLVDLFINEYVKQKLDSINVQYHIFNEPNDAAINGVLDKINFYELQNNHDQTLLVLLGRIQDFILFDFTLKYIENDYKPFLSFDNLPPQPNKVEVKKLSDLITNENSVNIVKDITVKYKNIKGKRLKILLRAFQELDLIPKERYNKKFHNCCKSEFNWNIASYTAMNDYEYNKEIDSELLDKMKEYIKPLIKT